MQISRIKGFRLFCIISFRLSFLAVHAVVEKALWAKERVTVPTLRKLACFCLPIYTACLALALLGHRSGTLPEKIQI